MSTTELVELRLGPIAHGGHTVARHEGRVVFVRHGIPGELVRARPTDAGEQAKFWRADVAEVLEPSAERQPHFWAPADALLSEQPVGGAEFGHIALDFQRQLKARVAVEQLTRLGQIDPVRLEHLVAAQPAPGDVSGLGWRTRMSYAVDASGALAMSAYRSNSLTAITRMPLAHPAIEASGIYAVKYPGISRVEVAVSSLDDRSVLVLLIEEQPGAAKAVARQLPAELNVAALTQQRGAAADGRGSLSVLQGRSWLTEEVLGQEYRITGEGFWQVHRAAATVLSERVLELLDPQPGQAVADLYAGAGLFSAHLAAAVGPSGALYSVEGAPGTHADAKKNLRHFPQAQVIRGRVERVLHQVVEERELDGVVLDPPRAGVDKKVAAELAASGARRLCYVSCDPASFARDTARLSARGYELANVEVHDLYPQTHHMELVGLFQCQ
ncbi:class I SAM-dependent RNA methyltransferase [Glutamicibacter sp. PS]|uniref:class I SAM-dependent RNA methyltransferase n=1 Tax=Glutamicibacter sp. PS TaxID=3075634 RepID=UPI00283F210B|nr:class I SAM-dependent RNA methyltransferase [Glutamicibacter sp. PS]MDR4532467.1 class I SAM-dependent RNA methyltransferase [Glutamicibacter sp. PS]